jgi:hypothetical protein
MEELKISLSVVLERAGEYFLKQSPIHRAAHRLALTLNEMEIPFAIAGALAVNAHGHVRTTEDVDILLRPKDLIAFKEAWLGRGWVEKFAGSRGIRDAVDQINIDVLLAGDFPGDGLPKPVAFPDPASSVIVGTDGLPILRLTTLLELKIASAMTAKHRPRDYDDAIQLIRRNQLPRNYGQQLNPYVHAKFDELWESAQVNDEY